MRNRRHITVLVILLSMLPAFFAGCRQTGEEFVMALDANPETLDPLRGTDASSERLRQLMFDSLVGKNDQLEYTGELASDIRPSEDGSSVTFTLHDGIVFHDGRPLTSLDVKYTLEALLASDSRKAVPFFEGAGASRRPRIASVEAPGSKTLIVRLRQPWAELLANLVPIGIIPLGSAEMQKVRPTGTGPFRFVRHNEAQQVVDLEANDHYWRGAPQVKNLRVRAVLDANTLQAELKSGRIWMAPPAANLSPDAYTYLAGDPDLEVERFPGTNVAYLGFNTESAPLGDVRVRQAIAYAIDREAIARDLLLGQARVANSMLPEQSWAYAPGHTYSVDLARAKHLLDEAGHPDPDGDGPRMRFAKPIVFKISSGNAQTRQYAGVIQNSLKEVGIPVEIETLELNSLLAQVRSGQYQMTTGRWVGGNQDPIFLRDLFTNLTGGAFNRSRYSNPELDPILSEAVKTSDRAKARRLYARAQEIISRDVPMLPLWYPSAIVVARQNVTNIKVDPSGDWGFVRSITVEQ